MSNLPDDYSQVTQSLSFISEAPNVTLEKAQAHWDWEKELLRLVWEGAARNPMAPFSDFEPLLEYIAVTHFVHGWKHCEDAKRE